MRRKSKHSVDVATVDRGLRVVVFLPNRDGWSDAVDLVNVGLFHAFEELAGIGGKRFDVAALPFGVDGVEGERALAGAGNAVITVNWLCGMSSETFFRL